MMMPVMNIMMMVMKFSCNLQAGPNDSADAGAAKSKGFSTFFLAEYHPAPGRILSLGFIVRWLPCCADFYRREHVGSVREL